MLRLEEDSINIFPRGDFEREGDVASFAGSNATVSSDTEVKYRGSRSMKVAITADGGYARCYISTWAQYKNRTLTATAHVRGAASNSAGGGTYALFFNYNTCRWAGQATIPADDTWCRRSARVELSDSSTYLYLYIGGSYAKAGDVFYVDDLAIHEGQSETLYHAQEALVDGSVPFIASQDFGGYKITGNATSIVHHTSGVTLPKGETGSIRTNLGAAGAILLTLPQDAAAGCIFEFAVMAAQALRISPGAAGAVYINGAKQTDNKYIWADAINESVALVADGNGDWVAMYTVGTWEVEA